MSHICKGEGRVFKRLEDIVAAAKALGWQVKYGEKVRYYYGVGEVCDVVVEMRDDVVNERGESLNKKYNIGFKQNEKGEYEAIYDNAMNGRAVFEETKSDAVTQRVIGLFKQAYNEANVRRQAVAKRKTVTKQIGVDGVVRMRIMG